MARRARTPAAGIVVPGIGPDAAVVGTAGTVGDSNSGAAADANGTVWIEPTAADAAGTAGGDGGTGSDGGSSSGKRRGRPRGSGTRKASSSLNLSAIEGTLFTIHGLLAGIAKTPELALEPAEAKSLAEGIVGVASHYNVAATEKTLAWVNLTLVVGMVYGTRIVAIGNRTKRERKEKASDDVEVIIPGVGPQFSTLRQ